MLRTGVVLICVLVLTALAVGVGFVLGQVMLTNQPAVAPSYSPPLPPDPVEPSSPSTPAAPTTLDRYRELWAAVSLLPDSVGTVAHTASGQDGAAWHARLALARCPELPASDRIARYRGALDLLPDPEVQVELAELLWAAGSREDALSEAARALPSPAAIAIVSRSDDRLAAAAVLSSRGFHSTALSLLEGLDGAEADLARSRALLNSGRPADAIPGLLSALKVDPDNNSLLSDLARAYDRARRDEQALEAYRRLGAAGAYGQARMLLRLGRTEDAAEAFLGSADPEALWRGGLALERLGRVDEAMEVYERLAEGTHRLSDDAAFRLWVLAGRRGLSSLVETAARLLPPDSHWQSRLGASPNIEPASDLEASPSAALVAASSLLDWYGPVTGWELARVEVEIAALRAGPAELLACGEWYLAHGHYRRATGIGIQLLQEHQSEAVLRLAYPLAYRELVIAAGERWDVDPLVVMSVMREESHFAAEVVSWAGAVGLMQIMPATGAQIAASLGEPYHVSVLLDPEVSIDWGAWYLRQMLDNWNGDLDRALASYNGGAGNVKRWLSDPLFSDDGDLPAVLDYTETREYVTKVRNTLVIYRHLYPVLGTDG